MYMYIVIQIKFNMFGNLRIQIELLKFLQLPQMKINLISFDF